MNTKKHPKPPAADDLRRHAEALVPKSVETVSSVPAPADASRLLHELQVHQIELEMQNAHLHEAGIELESMLAQYTELYEYAPVGYLSIERSGRIGRVNLTGARMLGLDRALLLSRPFSDMVEGTYRSVLADLLAAVFRGASSRVGELVLQPAHRPPTWVRVEAQRSPDAQTCRMILVDIDATKRAEEKLRAANAGLDAANAALREQMAARERLENDLARHFQLSPGLICIADLGGHFKQLNPSWEHLLGWTAEELLSRQYMEFVHPDDRAATADAVARLAAGNQIFSFENRYLCRDGTFRWLRWNSSVDVQRGLIYATAHDVTERRQTIEKLRDSEERYRALVETTYDWVWEVDEQGRYTYASPQVEAILGYRPAEILGRTPFEFMPAEEAARVGELFRQTSLARKAIVSLENTNLCKDGRVVVLETSGVPLLGPDGVFHGYRGMDRDVTERRRLEAQLLQSHKIEAVGRLAGGVAHDFNNILQAILGFCEILLTRELDADARRRDLLEIQKSALRAAGLTRQLLAFSRRQLINPIVLDLNKTVVEVELMLQRLIGEDVQIVHELAPDLHAVRADVGNMEQVIMNLVVNARDAMPRGGRVTIRTSNATFGPEKHGELAEDGRPGQFVCLTVSDTGCGMSPLVMRQIFDPFFSTKGSEHGTGLGLSVIHGIIKQHDGWIDVSSEEGRGSTFQIYLPEAEAPPEVASSVQALPAASGEHGPGERILLLEDEETVRQVLRHFLKNAGYHVFMVASLAEARATFAQEQGRFDLFFTDVILPDGNGFDIAEEFLATNPGLSVLLSSGYTDERVRWGDSIAQGFHFLQKPYACSDLLRTIREIFRERPASLDTPASHGNAIAPPAPGADYTELSPPCLGRP